MELLGAIIGFFVVLYVGTQVESNWAHERRLRMERVNAIERAQWRAHVKAKKQAQRLARARASSNRQG